MTSDLFIRPRGLDDDPRILDIYHQFETQFVLTLEMLRYHWDERARPEGTEPAAAVAVRNDVVVGMWDMEPSRHSPNTGTFEAFVAVDEAEQGQGVGSKLWSDLEPLLIEKGARKVYVEIREDRERPQKFATVRGFRNTGRASRMTRLVLSEVNLEGYEGIEERLAGEGIVIKPMSELDASDENLMRELHQAEQDAARDIPSSEEFHPTPFDLWQQNFMKFPGSSPDAFFVALHDGHPGGLAMLTVHGDGHATNGLTGVVPSLRGRGVAQALKLRTIIWARENGIDHIDTSNDAENAPMLAINVRLGYEPLPARFEWLKEYSPAT